MRKREFDSRITAHLKRKKLLKFAEGTTLDLASTRYAEWILIDRNQSEGDVLNIKLYYTDGKGIYHAYLRGTFEGDSMMIGDIGVLEGKGYAPKGKPPYGKGYGTALMVRAIDECNKRGVSKIYGKREFRDSEQNERQLNFYRAHFFDIDPQGRIYLELGQAYHLEIGEDGNYKEVRGEGSEIH